MTRRIEFIEIDIKKCQREYGVFPCTAAVGVTGSEKCFNCRASCQDIDNILESLETVRYSKPSTLIRSDLEASPNVTTPSIESIAYSPPELNLGKNIGTRASLSVVFRDHQSPDTDASGDNYISERNYDPWSQGTYWGKFRARYPAIQGLPLRWIVGTDDQLIADMETRHFVVDATTGPDSQGTFSITAKDVLRLTDGDQSVAPEISDLFLTFDVDEVYTGPLLAVPPPTSVTE